MFPLSKPCFQVYIIEGCFKIDTLDAFKKPKPMLKREFVTFDANKISKIQNGFI